MLWVVLLAQAINLIDGLDGLAAGIVAIGGAALFLFADRLFKAGFLDGSNIAPLIAIIAVGMCVGFLPFNFHPAKIIMGDAGALLLGLMLAVPTITVGGRTDVQFSGNTYFFFAPLVIPLVILGVPVVDTVFSFVRRVARGKSWSEADNDHLHHRLVRLGHGPRRAGDDPVGVDRAALGRRAPAHLHQPRQRDGAVPARRRSPSSSTSSSTPGCAAPGARRSGPATRRPRSTGGTTRRRGRRRGRDRVRGRRRPRAPPTQAGVEPGRLSPRRINRPSI